LAHPASLAASLSNGTVVLWLAGNSAVLDEWVDQLVAIATEQSFPYWRAHGTIYRGWIKVKMGDVAEGVSLLRNGSAAYDATGAAPGMDNIALLAQGCEIAGQTEEAVWLLDDALQIVDTKDPMRVDSGLLSEAEWSCSTHPLGDDDAGS